MNSDAICLLNGMSIMYVYSNLYVVLNLLEVVKKLYQLNKEIT